MSAPRGLVLDRDGVLTTIDRARFARDVLAHIPLPEAEIASRWRAWLGSGALTDAREEEQIAAFLDALANELELAGAERDALRQLDYLACVRVFDDARPALVEARRRGLAVAVLTNNTAGLGPARQLAVAGLDELVDVALSAQMVGARKPEPAAYWAAAAGLGLTTAECLFFDDTPAWVEGARRAGMAAWQVDRSLGDHDLDAGVVRDLSALSLVLERQKRS